MTVKPSEAAFRPDIEGLRAIAILVVVAYHAHVPGFGGGFVGVDVFFVLSGYLITGLLAREIEHSGTVDLARFYASLELVCDLTIFGVREPRQLPLYKLFTREADDLAPSLIEPRPAFIESLQRHTNCCVLERGVELFVHR